MNSRCHGILILLFMLAGAGCSTSPYEDTRVDIRPSSAGQILTIEKESGDMICVTEKSSPDVRTCVPRVHDEGDGV